MGRTRVGLGALALVVAVQAVGSPAACEPSAASGRRMPPEKIPLFTVVKYFFLHLSDYRNEGAEAWHYIVHDRLGIHPASEGAIALEGAVIEALNLIGPLPPPAAGRSSAAAMAEVQRAQRSQAQALGGVYRRLLRDLRRDGYDVSLLDAYIEEHVRPAIVITRSQGSEDEFWAETLDRDFRAAVADGGRDEE